MAERVKKRSEIREQDTWKLEDMIASPEKFEELADGVEERIPGYETYRENSEVRQICLKVTWNLMNRWMRRSLSSMRMRCRNAIRIPLSARIRHWCPESSLLR